jgi:5-methylcytosine-specific restriction protein B
MEKDWLQEVVELLRDRRQLIFYGPAGTGKTYVAQHLAWYLTRGDRSAVKLVQFHPSCSYEDFFEGVPAPYSATTAHCVSTFPRSSVVHS